jgi:DNA-binding response OmpR family regulator
VGGAVRKHLTPPLWLPVLVARFRALLRRTTGRSPTPLEVGDLRIDPGERRAWRAGTLLTLTAREFDVLTFLLRRAGQVLSKDEILAGVWEYDFDGDPNIVEVYVGRLRRKVDEPFREHSIETVRGVGYRLEAP